MVGVFVCANFQFGMGKARLFLVCVYPLRYNVFVFDRLLGYIIGTKNIM